VRAAAAELCHSVEAVAESDMLSSVKVGVSGAEKVFTSLYMRSSCSDDYTSAHSMYIHTHLTYLCATQSVQQLYTATSE
jgi:hypothetical protein